MAQGSANERIKMIRSMLNNRIPLDIIYKCVDLPAVEVDSIIAGISAEKIH